jgi:FG-GAP-like repeat/HYDIN/CFA65/VesB-like, Ig-like domain
MTIRTPPVCSARRYARTPTPGRAACLLVLLVLSGCPDDGDPPSPQLSFTPSQLSMEEVIRGHPEVGTIEVWNSGDDILEIHSLTIDGEGFSVVSPLLDHGGLGPGEGSWIQVTFEPAEDGPSIGSLTVESGDPEAPSRKIAIQAVGVSADVLASPTELLFQQGHVDDVQEQTVRLRSVGDAPLTVYGVAIADGDGAFAIDLIDVQPGPETLLQPGDEARVTISFQPQLEVDSYASLRVLTDDPQTPILDIWLDGPAVNTDPLCGITLAPELSVPEFTKIDLAAWASDGQQPADELYVEWWNYGPLLDHLMFEGFPEPSGYIGVSHIITGLGPHTLWLDVYDEWWGYCSKPLALQVVQNQHPTADIAQPTNDPYPLLAGDCLEFIGVVDDNEDGHELPLEWTSDHPQAPPQLATGTGAAGTGFHSFEVCDLPCGEQLITLATLDSAGQPASNSITVDVTVREPTLDPIPIQRVVLGQPIQIPLNAVSSCGVPPQLSVTGAPPSAVVNGAVLEYQPVYSPGDNPVGQSFQIEVHAEITHGNHTAFDDISFELLVVSDEYIAISGDQPDELLLAFNDYDGGWSDEAMVVLPYPAEPRAVVDLDGDGADDLLLVDTLGSALALLRRVDGSFTDVSLPWNIDGPVAIGDVDGDGRLDVVVLDPVLGATTHLNDTPPSGPLAFITVPLALDLATVAPGLETVLAATLLDHDGDGRDDLAVVFPDDEESPVYLALASDVDAGAFGPPQPVLLAPPSWGLAHGLLDTDAIPDLLTGGAGVGDPGQAYLHTGDGGMGFGPPVPAFDARPLVESEDLTDGEVAAGESHFLPTDVDHDGCTDLVVIFVSYLDPTGQDTVLSVGTVLQQFDGLSSCLGVFGNGSGEDAPDVILVTTGPAAVAVSNGG